MTQRSEYLDFRFLNATSKTEVWVVESKRSGEQLGIVKWHGAWRQYTLFPEPYTIFNRGCLIDICGFISELMEARKS